MAPVNGISVSECLQIEATDDFRVQEDDECDIVIYPEDVDVVEVESVNDKGQFRVMCRKDGACSRIDVAGGLVFAAWLWHEIIPNVRLNSLVRFKSGYNFTTLYHDVVRYCYRKTRRESGIVKATLFKNGVLIQIGCDLQWMFIASP